MNKFLGILAGCALSLGCISPVNALTTHKPNDWVANGDKGSATVLDENMANLKGASNYGPYSKASNAKLKDGIVEETYVDLDFNNIKNTEFFEVTLGLKDAKNEYVTEAVVMSQRVGDVIKVTAGWAPGFEANVTRSGIYTYRWNMYIKDDGKAYVKFSLLDNDIILASTDEISLDSEQAKGPDTKVPVAAQEDESVKYLWFCNIQVANGINVYSKLPGVEASDAVDNATNGVNFGNLDKINDVFRATLAGLHFEGTDENTAYEVELESQDINASEDIIAEFGSALKEMTENGTIAKYFDISLAVKDGVTNKELGKLENLTDKIELTLSIPEDLPKVESGYERKFYIIREHDDGADVLTTEVSDDMTTLTFASDKFSIYALAYEDVLSQTPNTIDHLGMFIAVGVVAIMSAFTLGYTYMKRKD